MLACLLLSVCRGARAAPTTTHTIIIIILAHTERESLFSPEEIGPSIDHPAPRRVIPCILERERVGGREGGGGGRVAFGGKGEEAGRNEGD